MQDDSASAALRAAAEYLYVSCELHEDEDLEPDDHAEVVRRAYTSSDCDDFAYAVHLATGWPAVTATWVTRHGDFGHHALVAHPDGRTFDVTGFVDAAGLRKRYRARNLEMSEPLVVPGPLSDSHHDVDDGGLSVSLSLVVGVVRSLAVAPFSDPDFRTLAARPIKGVDLPFPEDPAHAP